MPRKKLTDSNANLAETTETNTSPEVSAQTPEPQEKPKRARRNPLKKLVETVAEAVGLIEPEPPVEEEKPKPRAKKKPAAAVETPELPLEIGGTDDEPLAILREPKRKPAAAQTETSAPAEPRENNRRDRNQNRRRQQGDTNRPVVEDAPVAEEPAALELTEQEILAIHAAIISELVDDAYPVANWRLKPRAKTKPKQQAVQADASAEPREGNGKDRRNRRNKGRLKVSLEDGDEVSVETVAAPVVPIEPEKPKRPVKPSKPLINIPDDAPQVIVRNGVPVLTRNKVVYPPLFFFGNPADEKRAETVLQEVKLASDAGIVLYSYVLDLEVEPSRIDSAAAFAAYMLAKTVEIEPKAQVMFRINFVAPKDWPNKYPEAVFNNATGQLADPSVCDDHFWGDAQACLRQFVQKLRTLPYQANILGLHLERGEWFYASNSGYDTSKAATKKFRDWAGARYLDDKVALRASWFNGSIDFDSIAIPPFQPKGREGDQFVRSSRKQRPWVDYHLFLSDATMERIAELAYVVKEASEGYMVVGVSYGYTFEWSHPASGHLSLGKLLRTPEVDIIAGPPSYRLREPGETAPLPGPVDSFALNGKLFISEEDYKTSIAGKKDEPDDYNPTLKTPQALESAHLRGVGAALASASGVSWMDLWGNGWLNTPSIWQRAQRISESLTQRMAIPQSNPDVIVFIDERALAYLVDPNAFRLLVHNVRDSVLRSGLSAGFYLLSDLTHRENFPDAKLYIFINAWDIRNDLRSSIKQRLQRDNKLLFWLYSAGLFDSGRESLERAREVTGIAIKPQPFASRSGTTILNRRNPLCDAFPDRTIQASTKLEPTYFAIPEQSIVLGEYSQTGLPSFVMREFGDKPEEKWRSVFLGEPIVTPALIRALGSLAGAHIWNYQDDLVHVRAPFLSCHFKGSGQRTFAIPSGHVAYDSAQKRWVEGGNSIKINAIDGTTTSLLVGSQKELETLLETDLAEVLKQETLPERSIETRLDTDQFDIPIMKLDEWMEGGEEVLAADEWLLRPKLSDIEATIDHSLDEPIRVGSRRRNRREKGRHNKDRGMRAVPPGAEVETVLNEGGDDVSMNIVFRNRD